MAGPDDERPMLFDIRGRRRNVVKVVYAILALLMGLSLILLAGPIGGGSLFGGATSDATEQLEEQVERIDAKLKRDPKEPQLLLNLVRAQVSLANSMAEIDPRTSTVTQTLDSRQGLERASETWDRYVRATKEPAPGGAQVMAPAFLTLAETSRRLPEALLNIRAAADAQKIVADARPSLGSLSTLAIYKYFSLETAAAEKARKAAAAYANTKQEREGFEKELDEIEKRAKAFEKQLKASEKEAQEQGGEALQNPLGGLGGGGTLAP